MPQEFSMQEAIKTAVQTEKNVMDFYLRAAEITRNERAKKVFETLAREEREHAENFFNLYSGKDLGSFEDFMQTEPKFDTTILHNLEKALKDDVHERKAMEFAMQEEEDLARHLEMTAEKIVDPKVRAVFKKMAAETRDHYAIIESEYAHWMAMVHETDIDTYVRE